MNDILYSNKDIVFSDVQENDSYLLAKFVVCDFLPNLNGVMLNRQTIGNWISTLVDQPLVGKLGIPDDNGEADFTSHNANTVLRQDENGQVYQDIVFDTSALGVFTNVSIESIGDQDYIVATAKIWKRFPDFCAVIKKRMSNGSINTSWEILVKSSHSQFIGGHMVKVIDEGIFTAHCLLGEIVPPAYPDSHMLEVANKQKNQLDNMDIELVEALKRDLVASKDSNINSIQKEDKILKKEKENIVEETKETVISETVEDIKEPEVSEVKNDNTDKTDKTDEKEVSELTDNDVRQGLYNAISEKLGIPMWYFSIIVNIVTSNTCWVQRWDSENSSDLDVLVFTYTIENDTVTVSDPVESKLTVSVSQINSTIAELNSKIETLNNSIAEASVKIQEANKQISELKPFKEAADIAEQQRIEAETNEKRESLKKYATKSGFIKEDEFVSDEKIKSCIENVDESGIKAIIAERFVSSLDNKTETEVETSDAKEEKPNDVEISEVKSNITDSGEESGIDYKTAMKSYLGK